MCTGTDAGLPPKALKTSSGACRSYTNVVGSSVVDTDVRRLTTGIRSEKCVVRQFVRRANVIQCTYTNLDSTVQPTAHTGYMV